MLNFDEIIENKKVEVEELKIRMRQQGSTTVIRSMGYVRSFKHTLEKGKFKIIPELKQMDPWSGLLTKNFNVKELSSEFAYKGAKALAVNTDTKYFLGSINDVYLAAKNSDTPIFMRDFIIDEAQLTEAKTMGADSVMLLPSILSSDEINRYINFAKYILLEIAVEVSNEKELEIALKTNADVIGINNKDIRTQKINFDFALNCRKLIPKEISVYAIGGIQKSDDINKFKKAGFQGVLIGELLMMDENPGNLFQNLIQCIK